MRTLLFHESPLIGLTAVALPIASYYLGYTILTAFLVILLVFLIYFYRYYEHKERHPDNVIICPADGTITNLIIDDDKCFISIFLSPMNQHTQIYPANAKVLSHIYDDTGKFDIIVDANKSRDNEKAIHQFQLPNGAVITFTQIAGFLPRRISYDEKINHNVLAGEYLGMIKFGSRVDLTLPMYVSHNNLNQEKLYLDEKIKVDSRITIGNLIGVYK